THTILNITSNEIYIKKAVKYTNDLISITQNSFLVIKQWGCDIGFQPPRKTPQNPIQRIFMMFLL
ncbi:hypothetical protein DOS71_09205, partial [Staphylococcus felis]